jgi:DNA-binding NarL/FixJ family response regulator
MFRLVNQLASRELARLIEYGRDFEAPGMSSRSIVVERLLAAVADLVPGDIAVVTITTEHRPFTTYATDEALAAHRNGAAGLWARCVEKREHPVINYHGETGDRRAVMVSDFVSRATLHRTTLFDYFWRPFAIDRAMGTRIDVAGGTADVGCYRSRGDFSERDRTMLDGLTVHARRLLRRSEVAELAADCRVRFALTAREAEIVAWTTRGWTVAAVASLLVLSPATVKAHLRNVYRKTGWRSRAAAAAEVHGVADGAEGPTGIGYARFGLTAREKDVVLGVARGWTNAEIATAYGVTVQTAKTHLHHAYGKLGVGNRAQAVARLLE